MASSGERLANLLFFTLFFPTMIISFTIRRKNVSKAASGQQPGVTRPLQPGWLPVFSVERCPCRGDGAAGSLPGRVPGPCTLEISPNTWLTARANGCF